MKWFRNKIDNYITKHHSKDYIHVNKIKDEIKKRIKTAVEKNNCSRNKTEDEKLEAQSIKFKIQESGWMAEIEHMEKIVRDALDMKDKVTKLYYSTYGKAKELALIAAENKHEGNTIIQNVAESIGKLDRIGANADDMVKEIENTQGRDENTMEVTK